MKRVCVLGLGYIGLPTACMFATHGCEVIGVDTNPVVVATLNNGGIHIQEEGLRELVAESLRSKNLVVRQTPMEADVFIIAVPTPHFEDKRADMRAVTSATESIVPHLRKGNLVVLESTSPPLTTIKLVQPILEKSGLVGGVDFQLVYSPERVLPGKILQELVENARVIGGIDAESARAGKTLYQSFVKGEIVLTDATTAEMVKLMENTFRDVNIALANEFSLIAASLGVDVWEAISIANRHPRVKILQPGPGVGGHCIAIDPWFLVEAAPQQAKLIRQARQVNDAMPEYVLSIISELIGKADHQSIACLGLTFKPDVDDTRESPALEIVEKLIRMGYQVKAYDPYVTRHEKLGKVLVNSVQACLRDAELAVILVHHAAFRSLTPEDAVGMKRRIILDTRACLEKTVWEQAGFTVRMLGSGKQ